MKAVVQDCSGPAGGAPDRGAAAARPKAGEFRPVIDRRYAFEEVAEAHREVGTWRKAGNVVLVMPSAEG